MEYSFFKKPIIWLLVFLSLFSFSGCSSYEGYEGDYPELYTEAIYTLFGEPPAFQGGEYVTDPGIEIIEKDDYGRILYAYTTRRTNLQLFVLQMSDDAYAYYYPDYNFIRAETEYHSAAQTDLKDLVSAYFTDEDIDSLKEQNDFGKPFNKDKCVSSPLTYKKSSPKITKSTEKVFETICRQTAHDAGYTDDNSIYRFAHYLTSDSYGRMLFYAYGIHTKIQGSGCHSTSEFKYFDLAIIILPDWTYNPDTCVLIIEDMYAYQTALKEHKQLNNWDQPLE